jgi:hypothetical protein
LAPNQDNVSLKFTWSRHDIAGEKKIWRWTTIPHSLTPHIINFSQFRLVQKHCMFSHQACHKCSSRGPEGVFVLLELFKIKLDVLKKGSCISYSFFI